MATLRNLAVTLLRMAGATNVAKAAHLAGIVDVLTDVERRADALNRRAAELLDSGL